MGYKNGYQEYIKSGTWKALRKQALDRDGHKCVKCQRKDSLVVHHLQYAERWGEEDVSMLQTLCEDCHNILHGGSPRNSPKNSGIKKANRKRRHRINSDKAFAKQVKKSSPVKVFSPQEILEYQKLLASR